MGLEQVAFLQQPPDRPVEHEQVWSESARQVAE